MEEYRFQFNMGQIGRKISALRKGQNMTQMELADRLGISFQAVSNWERGNTMPDISKLPELAEIFHVTTDELLGETSGLVRSAAKGEMQQYMEQNPVSVDEFSQAVPLLPPAQAEAGFEKLAGQMPNLTLKDIEDILPQIGSRLAETGQYGRLENFLPFLPEAARQDIAQKMYGQNGLCGFDDIAPFLSKSYLNSLAKEVLEKDGIKSISPIVPFLDKEMLTQFIREKYL